MNSNLIERLISHADVLEQQYDPMVGAFDSTIALLREAAREMAAAGKLEQCDDSIIEDIKDE